MNKKGSSLFVILLAVIYFMFGMIVYQFLKPDITLTRTSLECTSPDTSGDMFVCLLVDAVVPAVIIAILACAGGYVTDKAIR